MIKKRQYHIWQYKLSDLIVENDKLVLQYRREQAVSSSETLMYYILNEKIMKRSYDAVEEYTENADGKSVKVKKNLLPLISIETGNGRSDEDTRKLEKLLNEGFIGRHYNMSGKVTDTRNYKFLDNVLSGSQNKECRQLFVAESFLEPLKEYISLGVEPANCTISKNLTRNALTTTDVYLIPIEDIKKLGICIIPDCEVPVYETVQMVKPYHRSAEEEKLYQQLLDRFEQEDEYFKNAKVAKKIVNVKNCMIPTLSKKNRQNETYKTVNQWIKEGRKVLETEIEKPSARGYNKKKSEYYPVWTIEQTDEYPDIPITKWSTGMQLVTEENHKCMENVFDGMGLVSKRLGRKMEEHLQVDYRINGYQLRLPSIKGFFPCVDFHKYYKKHNITTIKDIWNQPHEVKNIDLLITESTFKAKLNVTGYKEDGKEIKEWLFTSIDDYKERLSKYGYDVIGISNFAKPIHEQYRRGMYQMWLALNLKNEDIMAFSNKTGDMLHRMLSIYRKDELDWEDLKYLLTFLNLVQKEDEDSNLAKDCSDAIQAIHINKKMAFDRKVIGTIKKVVDKKINEMCLGKLHIKGIYTYITQDILAFLKYAGTKNKEDWEYEGFLKEKQSYCGGRLVGNAVLVRSPIVSYSEITKTEFIEYDGEDAEFISKINNIIQLPLGTECDRLGGADKDGDEVLAIELTENIKDVQIEYLQNYNFIYDNKESSYHNQNLLEVYNNKIKESINERFPNHDKVTLEVFIIPSFVQVNDDDKATAPSKEWNRENVIQFILDSEDQTGVITDYASTIANVANSEGNVTNYALPIAIMKDLQGKMIDASKSGLFDQVVIPEVIKRKFRNKPQFMFYKDGKEYNKDYHSRSALDFLAQEMAKYKKYVESVMVDKTSQKIKAHKFNNIPNLLQNLALDENIVEDITKKLKPLYDEFTSENKKLATEKMNINAYSSDEKVKSERKLIDEKFKKLYKETKEKAEKICDCPSLLATAAVRLTYILGHSQSRSFCWVVASEGILQNLKINEDKQKVYIKRSKERNEKTFEWLGEFYQVEMVEDEYIPDYKGKDMDIP